MGRAKRKRKMLLKRKRIAMKRAGKQVPFNLANCHKRLNGIHSRYEYKVNVHHCVFTHTNFGRVRYRSGHITESNFNATIMENMDFICVNLRACKFKNTRIRNCIFFGCNLDDVDFKDAQFSNVLFMRCKIRNVKNLDFKQVKVIGKYPNLNINPKLESTIMKMGTNETLEKFRILTINNRKMNLWMIDILLSIYTQKELEHFFCKLLLSNREQFYTLYDYHNALYKYYKR